MSVIERISYHLGRKDEVPNQDLARDLAEREDIEGIQEIASYLKDKNKSIASDCLKVLYEIGYIKPELIVPYKEDFITFLRSKNNRMVWGGMIGLSSVAKVDSDYVYRFKDLILEKIETGTVITNVWGVYTIINLAGNGYYDQLRDTLLMLQKTCRNVDFPKRAESIVEVIQEKDKESFKDILESRLESLSAAGKKRTMKVLKVL